MNSRLDTAASHSPIPLPHPGIDAVILLGASCDGPAAYAAVARELGYGDLAMPIPCDTETIRAQLRGCRQDPGKLPPSGRRPS